MDQGLGHLNKNQFAFAEQQTTGLVSQEEFAPLSTPSAHPDVHVASANSPATRRTDSVLPSGQQVARTSGSLNVAHASPLTPLRERDSHALDEMFDHDCLQEITLDIHRYLARMYPEPCWEDDPYEFLKGYT